MKIFNIRAHDEVGTVNTEVTVSATIDRLATQMDGRLLAKVTDELALRIVDEIYPEVIKLIDKEVIVKEVALQVSQQILKNMFKTDKD